jgi:creatinine amidohydrolase
MISRIVLSSVLIAATAGAQVTPPTGGGGGGQGRGGGAQLTEAQRDSVRADQAKSRGGGSCAANAYNCIDAKNPLPAANTVWIEEMTWMDVRDALAAGKTTAIISTGGIEPNGPWLVTGKHNYVLHVNCEAIARKLGNALCAPIVKYVPEGRIEPPLSHMTSPGTISMREETFRSVLFDVAHSLKMHGFKRIFYIGDSGGNQMGQRCIADSLNARWKNEGVLIAHIQDYYTYGVVGDYMEGKGIRQDSTKQDRLHDDPIITLNMWMDDPKSVRYAERKKAGFAIIDGISIADEKNNRKLGQQIIDFRAQYTIDAMNKAIANGGTIPVPRPENARPDWTAPSCSIGGGNRPPAVP